MFFRKSLSALALITAMAQGAQAQVQLPDYYPAEYQSLIEAAKAEGRVIVYGSWDPETFAPFKTDFETTFEGIVVEYNSMSSTPLHSRILSEVAGGSTTADLVITSAVDRQMYLLSNDYAITYESPEKAHIPAWAVWNDQGYSMTMDPLVFVYNKAELSEDQVPKSHAEIASATEQFADVYNRRIILSDVHSGGTTALFLAADEQAMGDGIWSLHQALADSGAIRASGTSTIIESVGAGESVLAYNMNGGTARQAAADNPDLGIILPSDFTLAVLRPMYVAKAGSNQNAGKLLLDYLLSNRAQSLALELGLYPVRPDIAGEGTVSEMLAVLGDRFTPIELGSDAVATLNDEGKRKALTDRWDAVYSK